MSSKNSTEETCKIYSKIIPQCVVCYSDRDIFLATTIDIFPMSQEPMAHVETYNARPG